MYATIVKILLLFVLFSSLTFEPTVVTEYVPYKECSVFRDTVIVEKDNDIEILKSKPKGLPLRSKDVRREINVNSYGWRLHPIFKTTKFHKGMDIACTNNAEVYSTCYGQVTKIEYKSTGYGINIQIKADEYTILYAHLNSIPAHIKPGTFVRKGQVVGYAGNTGTSTGTHLHYEVMYRGENKNPREFM